MIFGFIEGAGIQKSKELLEKKIIGKVVLGNAVFAFPGVQSYHPNPEPWFAKKEGGPVIDMGPYYLTALVNLLGPAKKVTGSIVNGKKTRTIGIGPKKNQECKSKNKSNRDSKSHHFSKFNDRL